MGVCHRLIVRQIHTHKFMDSPGENTYSNGQKISIGFRFLNGRDIWNWFNSTVIKLQPQSIMPINLV